MTDEETIKLSVSLGVTYDSQSYRSDVIDTGIAVEDWEAMSSDEQEKAGQDAYDDWAGNYLDGGWSVAG